MGTDLLDTASLRAAAGGEPWTGVPSGAGIGHVHLHVGDLERAADFYHSGLGLDEVVWSYPGALFLSAGGYHHHLGLNTWAGAAPAPGEDEARLLEWTVVLPAAGDVREAAASLEAAGYGVQSDAAGAEAWNRGAEPSAQVSAGGDGVSADGVVARDPWGTAVRLRADTVA